VANINNDLAAIKACLAVIRGESKAIKGRAPFFDGYETPAANNARWRSNSSATGWRRLRKPSA
jgi:hypothetical protein